MGEIFWVWDVLEYVGKYIYSEVGYTEWEFRGEVFWRYRDININIEILFYD